MPELANKPELQQPLDPTKEFEGPPEEGFWDQYNKRLEFPLSSVATVLLHVLVGTLLVMILLHMESKEDRSSVKVEFAEIGGMDEFGKGSAGSGGYEDPVVERINEDPSTALEKMFGSPEELPQIQEKAAKLLDPTGNLPITKGNAVAIESMNQKLRDKLFGGPRGTGNRPGRGNDLSPGNGPGGTGADSTLGRNMRWTLRFRVSSGRDYLKQLETMGAKLLIPKPGTDQCVLIENLASPESRRLAGVDELGQYGSLLKFADSRPDAVGTVARSLDLDFTPKSFFAVFSKDFENDLARKERNFANKRAEQIAETIFKVTVRGGQFEVVVADQKLR